MANWTVSDQLDARLRERLGDHNVSRFVETLLADQLNYDEDPIYQAEVDAQMAASAADIAAGRVIDARQAMRSIASRKSIHLDR